MFDFSRLSETITSLVGTFAAQSDAGPSIVEALQSAGLDPSVLTGLNETEIANLLEGIGVDPTQFADGQIGELMSSLGLDDTWTGLGSHDGPG